MDPRRGTYTCRQKGFLISIFDNSYAYKYLNFNSIINDYWMFLIVSLMTFHIFFDNELPKKMESVFLEIDYPACITGTYMVSWSLWNFLNGGEENDIHLYRYWQ